MAQVWLVTGSSRGLGRAIAVCSNGQNSISETRMRDTQNEIGRPDLFPKPVPAPHARFKIWQSREGSM
jgi:hypothetical protein